MKYAFVLISFLLAASSSRAESAPTTDQAQLDARWKGKISAGKTNNETICQTDLYATCAEILGKKLTDKEAPDSVSIPPNLLGAEAHLREATVHHSIKGDFAIRKGSWKLLLCPDSGGWSKPSTPRSLPS